LPPCDLEASSIEYSLATDFQESPESSAALASLAFASPLVRMIRRSRRSG
jgi:hypothetical protein